jgi:hypothetical protein
MAVRWGCRAPRVEGIAPSSALPLPSPADTYNYLIDPERLERLERAKSPDRQKWGASSSYQADRAGRGASAARHIRDGDRVLEIGTGTGTFRRLVADRCRYTGSDLQPLDEKTLALDIASDPIPPGPWDAAVMLGVLEYLHDPLAALRKVGAAAESLVLSYSIPRGPNAVPRRHARGWTNALSEQDLSNAASAAGLSLKIREDLNETDDFQQKIFVFARS